jgi:integrase
MRHLEKRANLYYAVLTVPPDVREAIGKLRFVKSTQTDVKEQAGLRAAMLVAGWKAEIAKARGLLPDPKATFWENMRREFITAQQAEADDDGAQVSAVLDAIEAEAGKLTDREEASRLFRVATGDLPTPIPLAPLVDAWKGSLTLAQKTIDQQHRDVMRMADHFKSLDALQPQKVKAWTDTLIAEGATAATLERMTNGCRSLWRYLQDSGTLPVDAADPFAGSFRLATKRAKRNTVTRQAFTPKELSRVYRAAADGGDEDLAHLIALGAYTGARIEELCSLTLENCSRGVFTVTDAKTHAGIRQIPIHPALVPLVTSMKKASTDGYLVPSSSADQYAVRSGPLSKRFGRLKEALGFTSGYVFHSIRKTVTTQFEQAGVTEGIAADILGHDKKTMSYGLYSSGSSHKQKLEAVSKVTYPGPLGRP